MKEQEKFELIEDVEDLKGKLEDCLESLKNGRELDSTQKALLKMLNLI